MGLVVWLKSKNVYLLYWLPFVVAAIAGARIWMGRTLYPVEEPGVLTVPFCHGMVVPGVLLLLLVAFFVFWVANKYQFLGQQTALPALIYSLLAVGTVCRYGAGDYLWAAACVAGAVGRLQAAIAEGGRNAPLFDAGVLVAVAVLLCPKWVMLLPWAFVALPFAGRGVLKDYVALVVGVLTVGVLAGAYYFYVGRLDEAAEVFAGSLMSGGSFWDILPEKRGALAVLAAVVLAAAGGMWPKSSTAVIAQRRGLYSIILLALFVGSSLFFIPFNSHEALLVVFLPLSYLLSRYFIVCRRCWVGGVLFLLLLGASLWLVF